LLPVRGRREPGKGKGREERTPYHEKRSIKGNGFYSRKKKGEVYCLAGSPSIFNREGKLPLNPRIKPTGYQLPTKETIAMRKRIA